MLINTIRYPNYTITVIVSFVQTKASKNSLYRRSNDVDSNVKHIFFFVAVPFFLFNPSIA